MVEQFDNRRLFGSINVACKFDDGSTRHWREQKEVVVKRIVDIVSAYAAKGYTLTLRQLHYQFVGHVPGYVNHDTAYKKLGKILDDCRYGGVINWDAIVDRGRTPYLPYYVNNIPDALQDTISTYRLNRQLGQETHVELWTEKDALSDILSKPARKYHVRLVVNKGYTSSSAMYDSYERFCNTMFLGQKVVILYFGDHDPSGLDMIRDIDDRLRFMFTNGNQAPENWEDLFEVIQIGLNMKQIKKYKLPPNPTKMTDTRTDNYVKLYGKQCWEVDALDPDVLVELVEENFRKQIDIDQYGKMLVQEQKDKKRLEAVIKKMN